MATNRLRFPETNAEYNRQLAQVLSRYPHMNLKRWKIIKSVILSLAVLSFGGFAILEGADPTTIGIPALFLAALIAGVEWSEAIAILAETSREYSRRQGDD